MTTVSEWIALRRDDVYQAHVMFGGDRRRQARSALVEQAGGMLDALEGVLREHELHIESDSEGGEYTTGLCSGCDMEYPCDTRLAIARALGVEP